MSSTAIDQSTAFRRTPAVESNVSSATASPMDSPSDTPRHSPSSSSLSSMSSVDDLATVPASKKPHLFDAYGNEFQIPDFTIKQIRDAIPAHCFERSALTGYYYILRDIACIATTFYVFHNYVTPETVSSAPLRSALWGVYTILQGLFGTGLWIIAHECGHQSFSDSKTINDITGWVLHSALLVPYFSWKISHGKHHKATGNMERDMVFVPRTRDSFASKFGKLSHTIHELTEDTPIATAYYLFAQQIGGWPAYLLANVTGHDNHEKQVEGKGKGKTNGLTGGVNHFLPSSPLYEKKDEHLILLSDLGLFLTSAAVFTVGYNYGFYNAFVWYVIPYLWVNHWLVAITFLQHTDPSLPHYTGETWNFARGAAATIDRNFWPIGPHLLHGIIETHVLHHFISTIPFYHADEATEAIKPIMGKHYRSDTRHGAFGFLRSLWVNMRSCQWVESIEGTEGDAANVLFFRNRNGMNMPPKKMAAAQ